MTLINNRGKLRRKGGAISLAFGAPVGIIAIIVTFMLPAMISGESLGAMLMIYVYGYGIIGLTISFLFALWFAGKRIVEDILSGKKLFLVSFRYSLFVNTIIWTTFIIVTIISNLLVRNEPEISLPFIFPVVIVYFLSVILTPVTIGLLVVLAISKSIKSRQSKQT